MPFKSLAQKAWMKHNKPAMFNRWEEKYGQGEDLPKRLAKKISEKKKK